MGERAAGGDFAADKRLLLIAAIAAVVGVSSTIAALVLLHLIRFFTDLAFFHVPSYADRSPAGNTLGLWVIPVPVLGGLLVGLIARYGSEAIRGHGIPEAIEAILFKKSRMTAKVAVLKPLASAIAIGSGGPFGAEGPIIMTGGAIGSLIAQYFHLTAAERKTVLVAGAVAGMTAIFGTPIAAVLLAVELLLFELRPRSLLPVATACAVAGFTRPLLLGVGPLFPLQTALLGPLGLASCVFAGLVAGALSWALSTSLYRVEALFRKLPIHWVWWPALGGLAVGVGGYFEPRALGVGYDVIDALLHGRLAAGAVAALVLTKAAIWVIALGSGTSGGVLAPLLMMGAGLGVVLAPALPGGDPSLWALVVMAAVLGGMMRSPVMSVLFAFELTHDVNALLPLLMSSATAYGFTVLVMPRSILTEKVAQRGYHIYREYGIDPMESHFVADVMTTDVQTIDADASLGDVLVAYFGDGQAHRAFPVLRDGRLIGMMDRALLRTALEDAGAVRAGDIFAEHVPVAASPGETCRVVANRLAARGLERLPVVEGRESYRLVGIVSRSDLVKPSLMRFEEEERRERLRHLSFAGRRRSGSTPSGRLRPRRSGSAPNGRC